MTTFQFLRGFPSAATRPPATVRGGSRGFNSFAAFHPLQRPDDTHTVELSTVSIPSRLSIRCNQPDLRAPPRRGGRFNSFAAFHPLQLAVGGPTRQPGEFQFLRGFPSAATRPSTRWLTRSLPSFNSFAAFHPLQHSNPSQTTPMSSVQFQFLRGFPSAATLSLSSRLLVRLTFQFLRGFPSAATRRQPRRRLRCLVSIPSRLSIRCNPHVEELAGDDDRVFQFLRGFPSAATFQPRDRRRTAVRVSIPSRLSIRCNKPRRIEPRLERPCFNSFAAFHPLQPYRTG